MAFDEHRPFESCIFCGSKAKRTREHMFGKALAKRFPVKHHSKPGKSFLGPPLKPGGGPITSVAPKVACDPCNTRDLSKDMQGSLEPLMRLIDGKPHRISPQDRQVLSRYWERVGLIADVMMSNYQITENYKGGDEYKRSKEDRQTPPLYSENQRKAWTAREKVSDMRVYFGFHPGVLGLDPVVITAHQRVVMPVTQEGITIEERLTIEKRFLMTIGKLSVCVWMGKDHLHVPIPLRHLVIGNPPPVPTSFRDLAIDNQDWEWPGTVPVAYEDFFSLCNQTPDVKLITRLMGNPELRQKIEEFSKQEGTFAAPPDLKKW